ncbi:hypothetical protein [Paenibacillus sp. Soil522]|uniref:hypothetical protein n=1 Tax=Paenibacillus sp. Soil522 TaxID=1736388 RepID=UPI0006F2F9D7|nr:hypothetical protein [Paenibacillus sp. Soil522]KRE47914.1 hypothetical protein ASG81_08350 [Paenibacillus sp. Soil522]
MDYSSFSHQLYAMLHYAFAFVLLMIVWPRFFLKADSEDPLENGFALFAKAVCIYIVLGYVLVALKLYEVISVSVILIVLSTRRFWRKGSAKARSDTATAFHVWFYHLLEAGFRIKSMWLKARGKLTMARKHVKLYKLRNSDPLLLLLLAGVLGTAAYVRFYDAVHYAAPALSDGSVTLAWMKFINNRLIFVEGIYPQGFHITLSLLSKFAAIDPLYILKYTGPLNGVLTAAGFYFVLSRLTGNKMAGIAGAALFGLGGTFLFGGDWERQAATNSQEFAYVFAFPALYFFLRYLEKGRRHSFWTGFAAVSITGFVHSLVFAFVGMGLAVAMIASVMTPEARSWKRIWMVCAAGSVSVVFTYAPIQTAIWSGISFNSSAAEFLKSITEVTFPQLVPRDYIGLGAIAWIALSALIGWRDKRNRISEWFAVGIGTATFLLYYLVPVVTKSTMLSSRTGSLWVLTVCFCIGYAWWSLWRFVSKLKGISIVERMAAGAAVIILALYVQLSPIQTYKMDWDSIFRQYLRISSMYLENTWTIFSQEEGYSLIYGEGWHQYISTLVNNYDPAGTPITRKGQDEYDPDVTKYMFVIEEKQVFKVSITSSFYEKLEQERYVKHEKEQKQLKEWLNAYIEAHGKPPIFYEDEHIRIWYLYRPDAEDKERRRIWGAS